MSLIEHAERELRLAGLFDKDSDYGGMLGSAVLELVKAFAAQGHSGFSASMARELFAKLADFKVLTPLTSDPSEWTDVSQMSGYPFWQSKRDPRAFSKDGGKTWARVDEDKKGGTP